MRRSLVLLLATTALAAPAADPSCHARFSRYDPGETTFADELDVSLIAALPTLRASPPPSSQASDPAWLSSLTTTLRAHPDTEMLGSLLRCYASDESSIVAAATRQLLALPAPPAHGGAVTSDDLSDSDETWLAQAAVTLVQPDSPVVPWLVQEFLQTLLGWANAKNW